MLVYHLCCYTDAFPHGSFCKKKPLHRAILHAYAFTQSSFYTQTCFYSIFLHTELVFLCDKPFQSNFYTQTLLQDVFLHTEVFSRTHSKGSRFTLRFGGCVLDVAPTFPTIRNRSQPFATVRNRSQPSAAAPCRSDEVLIAVPMMSAAKAVTFGDFIRCVTSFRGAGVAFREIPRFS